MLVSEPLAQLACPPLIRVLIQGKNFPYSHPKIAYNKKGFWICLLVCPPLLLLFTSFIFYLLKAEMKRFASVDTSVLKQHYEKKVQELEHEKKSLLVSAVSLKLRL